MNRRKKEGKKEPKILIEFINVSYLFFFLTYREKNISAHAKYDYEAGVLDGPGLAYTYPAKPPFLRISLFPSLSCDQHLSFLFFFFGKH